MFITRCVIKFHIGFDMPSIQIQGASVVHRIYDAGSRSFKNRLSPFGTNSRDGLNQNSAIKIEALSNIDLGFKAGDRVAILGPNGAGKSTLLRIISGLLAPTSGRVERDGVSSDIIDGGFGIDPEIGAHEYIVLQGIRRGITRKEIRDVTSQIYEFCGAPIWFRRPLNRLTPGQLFAVQFGTALLYRDQIITCDEIVESADSELIENIIEIIQQQIVDSAIIVVAERVRSFIEPICNRGIILEDGQIVDSGVLNTILARYGDRFTI